MSKVSNPLIESKLRLIYHYFVAQIRHRKFGDALRINFNRLSFYILHFRKMKILGELVRQFPLSKSHQFKIKFGALSSYLSRSFPFGRALPILVENYTFIKENFSNGSIDKIFCSGLECWRFDIYSIHLTKTHEYDYEGSFALIFKVGEKKIYTLSFSFVQSLAEPGNWEIFIARKQGQPGMLPESRKTAKEFNDNKIIALMLAATEGLALALGIKSIIGVGTKNQLSNRNEEMEDTFLHSYDHYWETQESIKLTSGDYLLAVPMLLKPLEKIPAHHKKRTIIKRQRRLEISIAVCALITSCCQIDKKDNDKWSNLKKSFNPNIRHLDKESARI